MEQPGGGRVRREATPASVVVRRCRLLVVKGAQRGAEFVIDREHTRVGKAPENDLAIADETVSRVHFEILRDARGFLLRDLRSTNGTYLDGAEIREAYLHKGSVIGAGACELRCTPFDERIEIRPSQAEQLGELVGRSPSMREIFGLVERIAHIEVPVLLAGEDSVGRRAIARTIHDASPRAGKPFAAVDCASVAGTWLESELFGHEKGAFVGAASSRAGAFETAADGTVFLEEIGELSMDLQDKLTRLLQSRSGKRLGGKGFRAAPRLIASSSRDLRSEVEKGKFRDELYQRVSHVAVLVPALRDRVEDIPLLAARFAAEVIGRPEADLSPGMLAALASHDWPGNLRELRSVIERGQASSFASGARPATAIAAEAAAEFSAGVPFRNHKDRWIEAFERRYVVWLLERAGGNISKAARDADMDRKYLHKLLRKYRMVSDGIDE